MNAEDKNENEEDAEGVKSHIGYFAGIPICTFASGWDQLDENEYILDDCRDIHWQLLHDTGLDDYLRTSKVNPYRQIDITISAEFGLLLEVGHWTNVGELGLDRDWEREGLWAWHLALNLNALTGLSRHIDARGYRLTDAQLRLYDEGEFYNSLRENANV